MAKTEKKAGGKQKEPEGRLVSENRKARHRFEILDTLECGIQLTGSEVKSLRDGKLSLDEAYARVKEGEVWLVGADIAEYPQATLWNHAPKRPRKLLMRGEEQGIGRLLIRAPAAWKTTTRREPFSTHSVQNRSPRLPASSTRMVTSWILRNSSAYKPLQRPGSP